MKRFEFEFHPKSTHRVVVFVHGSRERMRRYLRKHHGHDSANTDACCWQSRRLAPDMMVAEMHFGADHLTLESIAHECCHAGMWRSVIIGLRPGTADFEEYTATDTGRMTETVIAAFRREGYKLRVKADVRLARKRTHRYAR